MQRFLRLSWSLALTGALSLAACGTDGAATSSGSASGDAGTTAAGDTGGGPAGSDIGTVQTGGPEDAAGAAPEDAGPIQADTMQGTSDAAGGGMNTGGGMDAGTMDAGTMDAGTMDAGTMDAGSACVPNCDFKECGDDGCGEACGVCDAGLVCVDGACAQDVAQPPPGACTNPADWAIVNDKDVQTLASDCALKNLGNTAAVTECIQTETNLSDPCVACFGDLIGCAFASCLTQCIAGSDSPKCNGCMQSNCYTAFEGCSGLDAPGA